MTNTTADAMVSNSLVDALNSTSSYKHQDVFYSLISHLTSTLSTAITSREGYFNELSRYRNNYIVNGIYDIISSDVFLENSGGEVIEIKYEKDKKIEYELNNLFTKLNISNLLMSVFPELLHNGSYSFSPVIKEGRGVIDLLDEYDPRNVIAITDSKNSPLFYFVDTTLRERSLSGEINYSQRSSFEYKTISDILYLTLDLNYTKLTIPDKLLRQFRQKHNSPNLAKNLLPSGLKIKTPQSFIWPVLDKLKEVLILDRVSVYRDIGATLTPTMVGVPVPDIYDPSQIIDLVKKYDELLNTNVTRMNLAQNIELTLQELAAVKVIPVVGERSNLTPIDIGRSKPISSPEQLNDSLSKLLNSLGIPKELFDGSVDSKSNMKTNIRYAKKIKRIQKSISKSLKSLCLLHLSAKYKNKDYYSDDINIVLKNNVNVDELENLEAFDLTISSINNINSLISSMDEITSKSSYEVDADEVINRTISKLKEIGSDYALIFKERDTIKTIRPEPNLDTENKIYDTSAEVFHFDESTSTPSSQDSEELK